MYIVVRWFIRQMSHLLPAKHNYLQDNLLQSLLLTCNWILSVINHQNSSLLLQPTARVFSRRHIVNQNPVVKQTTKVCEEHFFV